MHVHHSKKSTSTAINRRAVLKGMGVAMALPLMESFSPLTRLSAAPSGIASVKAGPPRRFATMLFANGVNPEHWWAKQAAGGMELSKTLSPLNPLSMTFCRSMDWILRRRLGNTLAALY